jgi:aerobic C4-dicarboxylate transport protein
VLTAIAVGILLGIASPKTAVAMQPVGLGFIKLIRMLIAPVIFCTAVLALLYFEVMSGIALLIGLVVATVLRSGDGMNVDPRTLSSAGLGVYTGPGRLESVTDFLLNVIPATLVDAFAKGEVLQVLLLAILTVLALQRLKRRGERLFAALESISDVLFDRRLRHATRTRRRLSCWARRPRSPCCRGS